MVDPNQAQVDQTLSPWGSLERDVGSFGVFYGKQPSVPPKQNALKKCALYIPLAKILVYPCRVLVGFPCNEQLENLLKVQIYANTPIQTFVENSLGFVKEIDERGCTFKSMVLGWDEIRHIVIKSANEVEIGITRPIGSMHGGSKLVLMTHKGDEVAQFVQYWLIDNLAVTLRLREEGPVIEMIFWLIRETEAANLSPYLTGQLDYWYLNDCETPPDVWQSRKRTLFRLAHTLVDSEIVGSASPEQYQMLKNSFNQALELYWKSPDCLNRCWDDPQQLVAEEAVGFVSQLEHELPLPPVPVERYTGVPSIFRAECQVYVSYRARWYTITFIRFEPDMNGPHGDRALVKFYYKPPNQYKGIKLFTFKRQYLNYWKEICIVEAGHYALSLNNNNEYIYIRSASMSDHLKLRDHLINSFGVYYPTVSAGQGNATDTLMSQLGSIPLVAYRRLWTNPGGGAPDQLFYRTVESKRGVHQRNKKIVSHDMEQLACRMMDRYAFKLARALLRGEWSKTNADANVAPNETRRILKQLALYKSLLPDMTKWFHHAPLCRCDSCIVKEYRLREEHIEKGSDSDLSFYKLKLLLDCRIKHAHWTEPDY